MIREVGLNRHRPHLRSRSLRVECGRFCAISLQIASKARASRTRSLAGSEKGLPNALPSQAAFAAVIGLSSHCIRPVPALKPDCACTLQRKAGSLAPFYSQRSILFSPLCGRRLRNTGMFRVFRDKKASTFSAVKTCWRSRQSGANHSLPKFPANREFNRESCKFWGPKTALHISKLYISEGNKPELST